MCLELFSWPYGRGDGERPCPCSPNSGGAGALWWSAEHTSLEHLELSRGVKESTSGRGKLIILKGLGTSWEQRMCSTVRRSQAGSYTPPSCGEKKSAVPSVEWRGGKYYSECLQVATGCGSGETGLSAAPELPSLTAPRKADLLNTEVWRSRKGAGPPHAPGLRRSAKATSCSMPQPGGCRHFVLPCFVLALD